MVISRYLPIVAILLLAQNMDKKKKVVFNVGTLSTVSPTFITMLTIVILVIGALSFFTSNGTWSDCGILYNEMSDSDE